MEEVGVFSSLYGGNRASFQSNVLKSWDDGQSQKK